MKKATIEDLAYLIKEAKENNLPQPIVFLGAGASKTGGIPLSGEIVKDIITRYQKSPNVKRLTTKDTEASYSELMECLTPFERNNLLKEYIDRAKINVTHIYLAQLINMGFLDYVLTVNFDNLMLRALALYNVFPPTYDMAILKDLTTTTFKEKSVVYLHGQHHGLWLLNTPEEMKKVKEVIPAILHSIQDRPWIIIGYSGEDPIFEEIVKLGRFDKGLYWVSHHDSIPNQKVCNDLLEKENTNSFLINGYDADSFMLKLNNELGLKQPSIIDKPFTAMQTSLENIIDIDDKEHFKGVRKRLEIVKQQVATAIEQYELGKPQKDFQEQIDRNLLEKEIIDKIIRKEFNEKEIELIEKKSEKLKDPDLNNLLSTLYNNWGITICDSARLKNDEQLYRKSFEKYKKATVLNPVDDSNFYNWATALSALARLKNDESLYQQSFEKYEKATELNPQEYSNFGNWGCALSDLAILKNDELLYHQSFDKFEKATVLNTESDFAFYNWGNALSGLAKLKNDKSLYLQSFEKYEKATVFKPEDARIFNNWGAALLSLAKLKNDESLYLQSFEKYEKATVFKPEDARIFNNWGAALLSLAKLKNDESLYLKSFEKYAKAAKIKPEYAAGFNNWGNAILNLAKLKDDELLYRDSIIKFNKAIELGGSSCNLSCVYALLKEKENALKYLAVSLEKKEITVEHVEKDEDWAEYYEDQDFIELLNKYRG